MKLIAVLSWYSESPVWLAALVASLKKANVAHLVAVDGAYGLYPGALQRPRSGPEEVAALTETCNALGIGLTVHQQDIPWMGNEVEKRSFAFRLAETVATPWEDWYLVVDGDDLVTHAPFDLLEVLAGSDAHCAETLLWWRFDWHATPHREKLARTWVNTPKVEQTGHRALFRAIPGLRVEEAHNQNVCEIDGETVYLRGRDELGLAWADMTTLKIEHRHDYRDTHRKEQAQAYYKRRDELGVEKVKAAA